MIICPNRIAQKPVIGQIIRIQLPINVIIQVILKTVDVLRFLYIHIDKNVNGTKVAVKIMPHILTST